MTVPFVVEDSLNEGAVQFLENQIYRYNVATTGIEDGRMLSIILRDDGGIAAGLYGFTWGGVLEVKVLWVREELRSQGHGTSLLAAAEDEAIRRGCSQAILDTHSFQAPDFYQRRGYDVYGVVDGYPAGHSKYFLRKRLQGQRP
jgi:GNAT superfamily N-acetyltransferase